MARNDPSAPHPVTLGLIVPLANKATFRQQLRDLASNNPGTISFQQMRRILADDLALLTDVTDSEGGTSPVAHALAVHVTTDEFDDLKNVKNSLTPAIRNLVDFSTLSSPTHPAQPSFWNWAASIGYFQLGI